MIIVDFIVFMASILHTPESLILGFIFILFVLLIIGLVKKKKTLLIFVAPLIFNFIIPIIFDLLPKGYALFVIIPAIIIECVMLGFIFNKTKNSRIMTVALTIIYLGLFLLSCFIGWFYVNLSGGF